MERFSCAFLEEPRLTKVIVLANIGHYQRKQTSLLCHWMIHLTTIRKYSLFLGLFSALSVLATIVCNFVCTSAMVMHSDHPNSHCEHTKEISAQAHHLLTKNVVFEIAPEDCCCADGMTKFFTALSLSTETLILEVAANAAPLFNIVTPVSLISINTTFSASVVHPQFLYSNKGTFKRVLLSSFQI